MGTIWGVGLSLEISVPDKDRPFEPLYSATDIICFSVGSQGQLAKKGVLLFMFS